MLPDLVADDFVEQNPPPGQGPGRDGLGQFLRQMFQAFPDLSWQVQDMVAEGDRGAAWSTWTGTHRDTFMGVPPTGRTVSVEAWTIDQFRDGKLAESRIIMDVLGLLMQLGAIPAPGSPSPQRHLRDGVGRVGHSAGRPGRSRGRSRDPDPVSVPAR